MLFVFVKFVKTLYPVAYARFSTYIFHYMLGNNFLLLLQSEMTVVKNFSFCQPAETVPETMKTISACLSWIVLFFEQHFRANRVSEEQLANANSLCNSLIR